MSDLKPKNNHICNPERQSYCKECNHPIQSYEDTLYTLVRNQGPKKIKNILRWIDTKYWQYLMYRNWVKCKLGIHRYAPIKIFNAFPKSTLPIFCIFCRKIKGALKTGYHEYPDFEKMYMEKIFPNFYKGITRWIEPGKFF